MIRVRKTPTKPRFYSIGGSYSLDRGPKRPGPPRIGGETIGPANGAPREGRHPVCRDDHPSIGFPKEARDLWARLGYWRTLERSGWSGGAERYCDFARTLFPTAISVTWSRLLGLTTAWLLRPLFLVQNSVKVVPVFTENIHNATKLRRLGKFGRRGVSRKLSTRRTRKHVG